MKPTSSLVLTGAVLGLGLVVAGCGKSGGGSAGSTLAVVNGEKIGMDEFHSYLERKQAVEVEVNGNRINGKVIGSLALQGLRDLINRRILLQIAKDDGIAPTPQEVSAELQFQTKRRADFVKQLQLQGLTMDQIRADLTLDLARDKILGKGITVGDKDVDTYIKDNQDKFTVPPKAQLYWILIRKPDQKKMVDTDLNDGQPFKTVAKHYSMAPNAAQQEGRYPLEAIPAMPPRLQALIQKTPLLKPTEWIQDSGNWLKFFIEKKEPASKVKVDDVMRELVKRQIKVERGNEGQDLNKRLQAKLRNSTINVELTYLKTPWSQAFDALKSDDAQKQGEASGSSTAQGQ